MAQKNVDCLNRGGGPRKAKRFRKGKGKKVGGRDEKKVGGKEKGWGAKLAGPFEYSMWVRHATHVYLRRVSALVHCLDHAVKPCGPCVARTSVSPWCILAFVVSILAVFCICLFVPTSSIVRFAILPLSHC